MPDSDPIPTSPNFVPGVGRLVTDRYDFEGHVIGTEFRHTAGNIDLLPSLVIGGITYTDVQSAIAAINALTEPPVITPATIGITTANLGIVTLGGDFGGSALVPRVTGLQGKPVNTVPPAVNNVLTWGGTSWGAAPANAFFASGDLSGSNTLQSVISITGSAGVVSIASTGAAITWTSSTVTPSITQVTPGSGSGTNMSMVAQAGATGGNAGGSLVLSSGPGSGTGLAGPGNLALQLGGIGNLLEATYLSTSNRVLSLARPAALTTSQMPTNTGDLVVFVGNAATVPTASPSNGAILYATGGQLWTADALGNNFLINNGTTSPQTLGSLSLTSGEVITYLDFATSVHLGATPVIAHTYVPPTNTVIYVECKFAAKGVTQTDGALYTVVQGYNVSGGGAVTPVGTNTYPDQRSAGAVGFTTGLFQPTITTAGGDILVNTGYNSTYGFNISWVVTTKLTIVQTS